jgi:hypothetical protein
MVEPQSSKLMTPVRSWSSPPQSLHDLERFSSDVLPGGFCPTHGPLLVPDSDTAVVRASSLMMCRIRKRAIPAFRCSPTTGLHWLGLRLRLGNRLRYRLRFGLRLLHDGLRLCNRQGDCVSNSHACSSCDILRRDDPAVGIGHRLTSGSLEPRGEILRLQIVLCIGGSHLGHADDVCSRNRGRSVPNRRRSLPNGT